MRPWAPKLRLALDGGLSVRCVFTNTNTNTGGRRVKHQARNRRRCAEAHGVTSSVAVVAGYACAFVLVLPCARRRSLGRLICNLQAQIILGLSTVLYTSLFSVPLQVIDCRFKCHRPSGAFLWGWNYPSSRDKFS